VARPARPGEHDPDKENTMTKTAMQMIGEARAQVGTVAPEKAADELGAGAVFVDVREPEEWQHGHINGSVAAPRGLLEFFADPTSPRHNQALDPGRRVIVVCASGARASLAALTLKTMGYGDVAILDGGLKGWTAAGLPVNEHEYSGI
jgi:rhodanese-related sulfurtransferase